MTDHLYLIGTQISIACDNVLIVRSWDSIRLIETTRRESEIVFDDGLKVVYRISTKQFFKLLPKSSFYGKCRGFILHYKILCESKIVDLTLFYKDHEIDIACDKINDFIERSILYFSGVKPLFEQFELKAKNFYLRNMPKIKGSAK
jgi:hypothetical protein